ncbi:MAG TPA: InlB B-repeat-containing protein [Candidatus Faecousia intestinavium]|nr:InlB B-repeat-containing protein [Candidatus Faecousia intestinavium]
MEELTPKENPDQKSPPPMRGLYRNVKISVKTLDKIIIGGIIVLVVLILYGIANNGYTVTFDSRGGTDVPSQELMYGDLVEEPDPPTREGYTFAGWYSDENFRYQWDMDTNQVSQSMTLYAAWEETP